MTPPSTTPTSQAQPPVSPELNTPPTLTPQESSGLPEPISPASESSAEDDVDIEAMDGTDRERLLRAQQAQEKANRIVQEALAKAHASGNTSVRLIPSATIAVDGELKPEKEKKKKKSGSKKSKEPKPPKEPKEKKEKKLKTPRPKPKSTKKKKPLPTFLKKKKTNKRKTGGMSDDSEPEPRSPVQSDKDDDDLFKRRSSRNTKRKKYLDDLDLQLTDDDKSDGDMPGGDRGGALKPQFFVENPAEEDAVIVEKILGMRTSKKQIPVLRQEVPNADESISDVDVEEDADGNKENKKKELITEMIEVEEFFVKYKNFSYLHCEWKAAEDLKDKRIHMKIKRYKQKRLSMGTYFLQLDEDELFNSDYAEVDRILEESVTTDPDTEETVIYYMVKWRSLPYEDSTWELEQDVDKEKVEQFKRFQYPPGEEERQQIARPTPSEWKKLDKTRTYKNDNTLREYQLEGVNWLTFCYYNKQNCILADEMGLGKTIQSITYLHEIYDYGIRGPFLVIAPLSTIGNWQREFETWTDLNVITYHGTAQSRSMLQEYELYYKDEDGTRIPDLYKFHALITTYEVIISDVELLSSIEWRATVIDEAHRLKNQKCKLMEGLKVFDLEHRVLLTGTPLQNNVEELFSLLNFLEPSRFNNSEEFLKEFGELKTESQVEKLKLLLKPRMLRRLKEDVEKNLAAKEETIVEVELTNIQKKYYRAILEKNFSFLNKGSGTATNVPNLMNTMMELRKCCNHPYLVNGAEEKIVEDTKEIYGADPWQLFMAMVKASGKLVLIDKLLPKLMAGNHKVLIFSQMIRVLDILEDYLIQKKYLYERIDGRIRGNLRQEAIDRFSKPDSDRFVFLLCTRAGGLGINLTAADTVIIFDSDWNPQNDLQAQARCHRIGQKKAVKVYRLITRNSYEREMFDRASMKLGLDKAVLQSMSGKKDDTTAQAQLSKKEIEDLLRKGAYGAIMEDDAAGDQFCEEDIDLILQRRTQVIQIESEGKGSTFAKASFSVNENRNDIAIDDPNFWTKWAKKADIDTEVRKNDLIIEAPRARRQTTRFGNQDLLDMSELDTTSDSSANEDGDAAVAPNGVKLKGGKKGKVGRKRKNKNPKIDLDAESTPVEDGVYSRAEFFKVEKNLLVYGWGRWDEILLHGRFKRKLQMKDVQNITRALLVYSLKNYAGDERIKGFIWDLVNPRTDKEFKNHSGLSAPVPRGRKGHKARTEASKLADNLQNEMANCDITLDAILTDEGYKKHLQRHANKVLLRVRLLYYLKQEVIGDEAAKVFANYPASQINLPQPNADGEPPIMWWDDEADKSLLIGVFKHGYEKFNIIRQDSCLCFLNRCGPPDGAALLREQNDEDDDPSTQQLNESKLLRDDDDMDVDDDDSICPGTPGSSQGKSKVAPPITYETADGKLPFPGPSEINTRLRRVITGYQRNHKKEQLKLQQKEKKLQRRERFEVQLKEREVRKRELQQKWSRREESDFYRIVSTFGVQFDPHIRRYNWETFRQLARLDKKYDDTLTEYFLGFYYMCCRVCKKLKEDAKPPNNLIIEPITEERANRCLARIDLLNKVREEVLLHPKLEERLELCQSSFDMPDWWIPGVHDRDLLIGAARHGLARTDYHILHDPTLSFREIVNNKDLYKCKPPMPFPNPSIPNADLDDTQDGNKPNIQPKTESESDMDADVKPEVKPEIKSEKEDGEIEDEDEDGGKEVKVKQEVTAEESQEVKDKRAMEERVRAIEAKVKAEMRARHELRDESMDEFDEKPLTSKPEGFGLDGWTPDASLMGDEEMMARSMLNPAIQWPKDRVVFHRLEHICFCIEKGEWPLTRRPAVDSMDTTPSGTPLPIMKPDTPLGDSSRCDTPELFAQGDGLKIKIKKKKRRRKQDIEAERTARLLELYGHQVDSDSQQDSLCGMRTPTDSLTNDTNDDTDNDHGDISIPRESKHGIGHTRTPIFMGEGQKKRGRKRKVERMPDDHSAMAAAEQVALAMAQATGKKPTMHRAYKLTSLAPEARVPVVNIEDGSRLSGEEAPSRLELEEWLDNHPGYMVDLPDDQIEPAVQFDQQFFIDKRKKRRPRLDPAKLDLDNLTGEENVSVVNKVTGKRITGAKAPPLKHLAEWLTQNANFFVDPKWAHLVKEKGNLPEALHSRILFPSEKRRGRPPTASSSVPRSSQSPYSSASQMNALAMANPALMKLGMGIPFGALPSLGMNPMFSMANMAAFGLPMTTAGPTKTTVTESSTKNDSSDSDDKTASSAGSFPLMYNPMLYNSIMAAQMGNFSLPANIPTSFATLAQAQMLNGAAAAAAAAAAVGKNNSESEDNPEQMEAQDLSIKKQKKHSPKTKSTKHKQKVVRPENELEEGEILNLATKKRRTVPEEVKVVPTATKSDNEADSDDQS
ncbi:chromodomain-helicase-DNA-binding protein 7-like isoform X2 [Lineus longissimus]